MIDHLLNQTAELKKKIGTNAYGEPSFDPPITIKVRWEDQNELIKTVDGSDATTSARIFSKHDISIDDILVYKGNEWSVLKVLATPDSQGNVQFIEVLV